MLSTQMLEKWSESTRTCVPGYDQVLDHGSMVCNEQIPLFCVNTHTFCTISDGLYYQTKHRNDLT